MRVVQYLNISVVSGYSVIVVMDVMVDIVVIHVIVDM